ncbi:MAG: phosphotransferase [Hyphomonadaceae bacterium]|nr:phosphotransferase [Hyphomonadaceae bacterium]
MTSDRAEAYARVIADAGFAGAEAIALAGDASTRRYERLVLNGRTAILMDAPRSAESGPCPPDAGPEERLRLGWNATSRLAASRVEAFIAVADQLRAWGLSAPAIYAADIAAGYAVIEDLGDDLFARVIPARAGEAALYRAAADVLAHLHRQTPPARLAAPDGVWPLLDFDALALQANADLFVDWLPRGTDVRIDDGDRARWEQVRDALIAHAMTFQRAFTLRDYHAENLVWLPQRDAIAQVGLLDFQDAVRGWRGWDFTMLLHDARRDVGPDGRAAAVDAYLRAGDMSEAAFNEELAILGALNVMRILGLFARLVVRDGKPRYADFMPRMWAHLRGALAHPALGEARAFVRSVAARHLESAP